MLVQSDQLLTSMNIHMRACVEMLGPYQDSGFTDQRFLVRRDDGTVVQLSRLLYAVVGSLDGDRPLDEVARSVSADLGRILSVEDLVYLVEHKLSPLGVVCVAGVGASVDAPRGAPAEGRVRAGVRAVPPRLVRAMARPLMWLFRPLVVAGLLGGFVATDVWLFGVHGAQAAMSRSLVAPPAVLALFGLTLVAMLFHELGHATACRYGGASPGTIGVGRKLVWLTFFTDVTDSYRLDRRGRLRVDLGGVYFNAAFVVLQAAAYAATGWEVLLAAAAVQQFFAVIQLLPVLRLDGFFILSDLTGVPDLHSRIGPVLRSVVAGRRRRSASPVTSDLRPRVRVVVVSWVIMTAALGAAVVVLMLLRSPEFVRQSWLGMVANADAAVGAWRSGEPAMVALAVLVAFLLAVPLLGLVLVVASAAARLRTRMQSRYRSRSHPEVPTLTPRPLASVPDGFMAPEEITGHRLGSRRGRYRKDEVDAFLAAVARQYAALGQAALRPDPYDRLGDEVAAVLRAAHGEAAAIRARAEEKMAVVLAQARQAHEEAVRTLDAEAGPGPILRPRPPAGRRRAQPAVSPGRTAVRATNTNGHGPA